MPTLASGTLTIATSEPAFEPWVVDNDPTNGNGFESAVAYAVADRLGYLPAQVTWTRVGFDEAIAKPDGFDFDINQFTITDDRKQAGRLLLRLLHRRADGDHRRRFADR